MAQKILVIRMLDFGDVTCIGLPGLRYIRQQHPDAELHCMTYGAGEQVVNLAMPDVTVLGLKQGQWPDDIFAAMEAFLGLAEDIIGNEYSQTINLDTCFMSCFLARFLKDAGEPVKGNYMSLPVAELINGLQEQSLSPDYVNRAANYLQSSWLSMQQWLTAWWEQGTPPGYGYAEFYLRRCCGFSNIEMDMHIDIEANVAVLKQSQRVVALHTQTDMPEHGYPYARELKALLEKEGITVWQSSGKNEPVASTLSRLKACSLLVTVPSAQQWLATSVATPTLLIVGTVDPRTLMPDYATDMSEEPVAPEVIVAGVLSILDEQ